MSETAKTIIVTGAAQGIGLACAKDIVARGWNVVMADVNVDEGTIKADNLRLQGPGNAIFQRCDITKADAIDQMIAETQDSFGAIDGLVNNAAIVRKGSILTIDERDFDAVFQVNLLGQVRVSQRVGHYMCEKRHPGSIVNMSSINGTVAIPDQFAYVTMKGAVNQMTKAMALAMAEYGIRVNAVAPGSINTEMMQKVNNEPRALRTALARTPLRRLGESAEVAKVVSFLLSDDASYMTGEIVTVDGGRLALNYLVPVNG
jgi:NAD(P)-dependent dehydrogenase (short-subunit alcohol dehydrogenase family)